MSEYCGIYMWTNVENGKRYIGQSIDIKDRYYQHLYHSGNDELHSDIRAGKPFIFSIIELCDKNELNIAEGYWIDYYDSVNTGYNKALSGGVGQYDLEGNLIAVYNSRADAKKGTNIKHIGEAIAGQCLSAGGYKWKRYVGERRKRERRRIYQYDINTEECLRYYTDIHLALKDVEGDNELLLLLAADSIAGKTAYGFKWDWTPDHIFYKYEDNCVVVQEGYKIF